MDQIDLGPVVEVALVWPPSGDGADSLISEVFGRYLANRVVAGRAGVMTCDAMGARTGMSLR